jgi:hypothetical protein
MYAPSYIRSSIPSVFSVLKKMFLGITDFNLDVNKSNDAFAPALIGEVEAEIGTFRVDSLIPRLDSFSSYSKLLFSIWDVGLDEGAVVDNLLESVRMNLHLPSAPTRCNANPTKGVFIWASIVPFVYFPVLVGSDSINTSVIWLEVNDIRLLRGKW